MIKNNKKGTGVIEILVIVAILSVTLGGLLELITFSLKTSTIVRQISQADVLAQETMEEARSFRDGTVWNTDGLGILTLDVSYYPVKSGSPLKWDLISGTENVGIFQRQIVFSSVSRDENKDIVLSGGTIDPDTKKATVIVSRPDGADIELVTYFTNWR
ncbi:MAG: hypothetical protein Q7T34_01885 [Candidatus Parcubacteria bacterium]|nr:hypothetical protein [Candidatus Parcubacteria bacterium]